MAKILNICFIWIICAIEISNAQKTGIIIGENVNVRSEPSIKSKLIGKITNEFTSVKVLRKESQLDVIKVGKNSEMKNYWYQVTVGDTLAGYVFGNFIEVFSDATEAQLFIDRNIAFRDSIKGTYILKDDGDYLSENIDIKITFAKDGKAITKLDGAEGDHIIDEKGIGRYFIQLSSNLLIIRSNITGSFAPDGYSWSEYFSMTGGNSNDKAALDKFIKESSNYTYYQEKSYKINRLPQILSK